MATPTIAINKKRVLDKLLAILFQPAYSGSARGSTSPVGNATVARTKNRVWVSAGVPSGGTGVADGDVALDTTNDNVYRYYNSDWDGIDITS